MLTREFAQIRDEQKLFDDLDPEARPSFHEIRTLGADIYRQAGTPVPITQRLLGHTTTAMTAPHYLDGHDTVIRVRAGVKLPDKKDLKD